MPEKADKKHELAAAVEAGPAAAPKGEGSDGGGLLAKTPVLLGGVMLIEAVVLFAGFKFLSSGGPHLAVAAELVKEYPAGLEGSAAGNAKHTVELNVLDFRATNKLSGRTFLFDVSIYVVLRREHQESVKNTIKEREALIQDRIRTIIAQSDPERLGGGSEPGLETLRRQVKHQLDEIVGEGMIEEVLIPRCIPFRVDF
jgi:flagellar basal body-associated protein FliL